MRKQIMNESLIPKYPFYIISKNRADSMLTSRALSKMKQPHYIAIEPHNYQAYEKALDHFKIRDYVTLLTLPFENHGDGPGRARNWCWDHSIHLGAERHWVFDDNIMNFMKLHKNRRYITTSSSLFRAAEDFVDRFENVPVSGLQYRMFIAPNDKYPPFTINTRIFSSLLIHNKCKFRWRGRYSEDVDLSLRVLKDGDCTIQFNFLLQDKIATQKIKGGNTEEFYHKESLISKEEFERGHYNPTGTINKSKMIVDMHPDVCKMVWKYGRVHHYCDFSPFKKNKLIYKPGVEESLKNTNNEYGVKLLGPNGFIDA